MLEIKGRPFIDYQLKWLKKSGITNIVLCVSHLGQKILEYVKDGSSYGLQVNYAWDGKKLLGTGGAVKNALPLLGKTFYVLYGDSFLSIDFREMYRTFQKSKKEALLSVYKNDDLWDKSNTVVENGNIIYHTKQKTDKRMKYIDYGASMLSVSVFDNHPNVFDLSDLYKKLAAEDNMAAYIVTERFFEIGSKAGLGEFSRHYENTD
jgi:NDP-sugar pyrophosphorylase family protein